MVLCNTLVLQQREINLNLNLCGATYVCVYVDTCAHGCVGMCVWIRVCVHARTRVHVYVWTRVRMYAWACVCVCQWLLR